MLQNQDALEPVAVITLKIQEIRQKRAKENSGYIALQSQTGLPKAYMNKVISVGKLCRSASKNIRKTSYQLVRR